MDRRATRFTLVLLLAALPPVLIFGALAVTGVRLADVGAVAAALALTVVWVLGVTPIGTEIVAGPRPPARTPDSAADALDASAPMLEERNRQISQLAAWSRVAPVTAEPTRAAHEAVTIAREVTGDPTWALVVVVSPDEAALPPGAYGPEIADPPEPVEEVHRWAVVQRDDLSTSGVDVLEGPWGAFLAVRVAASDTFTAILLAPWAGRARPTEPEVRWYTLVGQICGITVDHALLYDRLRRQTAELDRLASAQRDFLRSVTHDLQTPLTRIGVLAGELQAARQPPKARAEDLAAIVHQAERMRRMVQQLLAVSHVEAGVLIPRQEVIQLEPLVRRTWTALAPPDRVLDLSLAPLLVIADPDRLEQVLWALLDNAIKYGTPGTPIEVASTALQRRAGDPGLDPAAAASELVCRIRVVNRGEPLGQDERARAFELFYRAPRVVDAAISGSGVGLHVARELSRLMGGTLAFDNAEPGSIAIVVCLPAEPVDRS